MKVKKNEGIVELHKQKMIKELINKVLEKPITVDEFNKLLSIESTILTRQLGVIL